MAIDESTRQTGPVRAVEPDPSFIAALRDHETGRDPEAASAWYRIIQAATPSEPQHRFIAEYQLAVLLARLGLVHASAHWLGVVAEDRNHPMRLYALIQLGRIAQRLSESGSVVPHLSGYGLPDLDRLQDLAENEKAHLAYLLGRSLYERGDYAQAQLAFARLGPAHAQFVEAKLFESACHVRLHHAVPALTSLMRGVEAVEKGEAHVRDRQRWLDLCHLSAARIYYSSAIALDAETNIPQINSTRINAAVKYYNLVEPTSEYFEAATFELAWVYFMAGQYPFALGKIFSLDAPYYDQGFHPESLILKAVVYDANCNYEAATVTRARFNTRYIPLRDSVKLLIRQFKLDEPGRLVRVFDGVRRRADISGQPLELTVAAVYRERAFLRMLDAAEAVEAEVAVFEGAPAEFKRSALGTWLRQELEQHRRIVASRADEWLRAYLQRRVDEIDEHVRNGEKILLHHYGAQRNLLDARLKTGFVSKAESNDWGRVRADEEHVIWPFDGEYWKDELGTYRQTILSTCGR